MGKTFKNHTEFIEFEKIKKQNSDLAERLVKQVEEKLLDEYINEQNILNEVGKRLEAFE